PASAARRASRSSAASAARGRARPMRARLRQRGPRLSPSDRRAQLIQAAVKAFLRRGYLATKVKDVVREARVARGTFYLHFESKRQLLTAVARELLDRLPPRQPLPPPPRSRAGFEQALEA